MPFLNHLRGTENFMEALVINHEKYRPIVEILDNIVQNSTQLSWADYSEVAIKVSQANRCGFCSGIYDGMNKALKNKPTIGTLSDNLYTVIEFALKVNEDATKISEKDIQRLRDAGFNDQTIEDVVAWVASIRFYNITANGLGFKGNLPERVFVEMGEGTVEQQGYIKIFDEFVQEFQLSKKREVA